MKCVKLLVFFCAVATVMPSYILPETTTEPQSNDTVVLHRQERQSLSNPKKAKQAMDSALGVIAYVGKKLTGGKISIF